MVRFLHLADIHLGFDRYDSKVRTQDFFYAFQSVLERYAIAEQVDFVLIAGDLFEHRSIQPATLNQAQICLTMLQEANIPVIAIEGNHDNRPYSTKTSWLRYLSDWGLLILLEPGDIASGEPFYSHWDGQRGSYIDLAGARILGSNWYGATAPQAIERIAEEIQALKPQQNPQILMFHHGLEGQVARYAGALRYSEMLPLKHAGVDYLALGHIHKSYSIENWIFNPGSLEANSIEESLYERGAFLVELSTTQTHAQLITDYQQRPIVRLSITTQGTEMIEEVEEMAIAKIDHAISSSQLIPAQAPIVELKIEGRVGFDRLDLDLRKLHHELLHRSEALILLLKFNAESVNYASHLPDDADRYQLEQDVFSDILAANNIYKKRAQPLAKGLIELKDLQLSQASEEELYEFARELLQNSGTGSI